MKVDGKFYRLRKKKKFFLQNSSVARIFTFFHHFTTTCNGLSLRFKLRTLQKVSQCLDHLNQEPIRARENMITGTGYEVSVGESDEKWNKWNENQLRKRAECAKTLQGSAMLAIILKFRFPIAHIVKRVNECAGPVITTTTTCEESVKT